MKSSEKNRQLIIIFQNNLCENSITSVAMTNELCEISDKREMSEGEPEREETKCCRPQVKLKLK